MSTRSITILIVSGLVALTVVFFMLTSVSDSNMKSYSFKQVESHNSADNCWTIINNSVYNITSYIPQHPGGDEILEACGEDATTMFMSRRDVDGNEIGTGTPHSSNAKSQLNQLKIGTLVD